HIFEPRYRDMLRDCLAGESKLLAVTQLRPGWEPEYNGSPALYEVAGVGEIEEHRHNPDGTYDIVVRAFARVRLEEVLPQQHTYRSATATILRERTPEAVNQDELAAVLALAGNIATIVKRALPGFTLQTTNDDGPGLLSDRIADQFVLDPQARQDLLETLDVGARLRTLTTHLAQLHMALCSNAGSGSHTLH
ncbi:MAG TPA: LON peptidase substrate-binding domain-containing protein, partial [Polyangiales bacterium]|nr:LON peptidase substrate-binding domain-containing protein [Polyangiales bacterium]